MSIIGDWEIFKTKVLKNEVVVRVKDVIDIKEIAPVGIQRRAKFTCFHAGIKQFSGDVDLDASGDQIAGAFEDGGAAYVVKAQATGAKTISGETWRKIPAAESGGEWDGNRK